MHKVLYLGGDIFLKKDWGGGILLFGFSIMGGGSFSTFLLNDKKGEKF